VLGKDGGDPEFFAEWRQVAQFCDAQIRQKARTLDDIEQIRLQLQQMRRAA
jgi:hypothetical protein